MPKCKNGTLHKLRELYPNQKWRGERYGFGWRHRTDDGWVAQWFAFMSWNIDGGDDYYSRLMLTIPRHEQTDVPIAIRWHDD